MRPAEAVEQEAPSRISILTGDLIELGRLALQFGDIQRITRTPEGSPETDTTHSIMLVWIACALAARSGLDVGLVAQLAAVHDAPEAIAGDTQTLRISTDERSAKESREERAALELYRKFGSFSYVPWFGRALAIYRAQVEPEARFVRAVDKCLPKITHILNRAAVLKSMGMDAAEFRRVMTEQVAALQTYAAEFEEALAVREALVNEVESILRDGERVPEWEEIEGKLQEEIRESQIITAEDLSLRVGGSGEASAQSENPNQTHAQAAPLD